MIENIDEHLIKELQLEKELLDAKFNSNILFDIKTKKFISADAKTITCTLTVEMIDDVIQISPNLVLLNSEFIRQGVFNFQKNHDGCLRATFTEDSNRIELDCYTPFFKGVLIQTKLNRIIQFPKIDLEQNPQKVAQWESLKQPVRKITKVDDSSVSTSFTTNTQKYFWLNCYPTGFIICGINVAEKTLLFTTKDIKNRIIADIPKSKKSTVSTICNIWPELKPYLEITEKGLILSLNKINLYLPDISKDGVYRITKHHHSDQMHAFITHVNCC